MSHNKPDPPNAFIDSDSVTWERVGPNRLKAHVPPAGLPAHATTHYDGGSDEVDVTQLGGFPNGSPATEFLREDGTWATPSGGGTGGILAIQEYRPGTQTIISRSANSWAALDTTNLKVTFTAPSTGHVLVRLQAFCDSSDNNSKYQWRLTNNSSTQYGWVQTVSRDDDGVLAVAFFDVDGLTPGNSYTFYWEHKQNSAGTGRVIIYDGTDLSEFGPAYMIVETAP